MEDGGLRMKDGGWKRSIEMKKEKIKRAEKRRVKGWMEKKKHQEKSSNIKIKLDVEEL